VVASPASDGQADGAVASTTPAGLPRLTSAAPGADGAPSSGGLRPPTRPSGLTADEVAARVAEGLDNDAGHTSSRPLKDIIRANVVTPFNALLGGLALLVMLTGAFGDALFGLILVVNAGIGILQELRAKRTLDRLAVLSAPHALVLRDGDTTEIPMEDVVLDDLVVLRPGEQVPADCRLRDADGLEIDESLVTGESDPVPKHPGDGLLSGSTVVAGSATAQVSAVGADSFANRLTGEARQFSLTESELSQGINRILRYVAIALAVVGPILFISQFLTTSSWRQAVQGAVAGMVGMVPEGLVLLASVTFFAAALTLARRRVLVRELPAVEGLARVDVLCLDKTGTLTEGRVVFAGAQPLGEATSELDQALGALAHDDAGNATMVALQAAFPAPPNWERVARVAFSSARKWSAATFRGHGTWVLGAPEVLFPAMAVDDSGRHRVAELAARGTRTLLLGRTDATLTGTALPPGLIPESVVTFQEHIRPDAAGTLRYFTAQGVALKIISGDSPATVGAIARQVDFPGSGPPVDARSLPTDTGALETAMDASSVFGRVTPQQKRSMVDALKAAGHTVAMTGDGVNDVLALKDADIGVAMGSGTAATRAVAQLVLLDSEFSVLPKVVAEGRRVIANVERVANLFLVKNVTSLMLAVAVAIARWPFPFQPRHLTLISTLVIGVPGFFLALGPSQQRFEPGLVRRVITFAVPAGVIASVAVFVAYGLARAAHNSPAQAKTAATIVLFGVSFWVLVIQSRPWKAWKLALVAAMAGAGVLAFLLPLGRRFYDLRLPSSLIATEAAALAAGGAVLLEVVSHWTVPVRQRRVAR
jgi:cation-transporting ATPase E